MDDKYSVGELAKRLDKSYNTTLNLIRSGKIKGQKYGGNWGVDKVEVERFIREGNHPESEKYEELVYNVTVPDEETMEKIRNKIMKGDWNEHNSN